MKRKQEYVDPMNDGLRRRASAFIDKNKLKIRKDPHFQQELLKEKRSINIGFEYSDVGIVLDAVNNLLMKFGFVRSVRILQGRAIKSKNTFLITGLITDRLQKIQLRPFKNGVALVLKKRLVGNRKMNKKEIVIGIGLEFAKEEDDSGNVMEGFVWRGSGDGLHKKNKRDENQDVWSSVREK